MKTLFLVYPVIIVNGAVRKRGDVALSIWVEIAVHLHAHHIIVVIVQPGRAPIPAGRLCNAAKVTSTAQG